MQAHETITISTNEYLTHELVEKISAMQWDSTSPECINRIRRMVYGDKYDSDCFNVLAYNETGDVVGRMYCAKNQENPKRWYYGDLAVKPSYRRMKIATKMIKSAIEKISDMGGDTICCYVEPSNTASIGLQKQFGFVEKPTMPFNLLIVDGEIMFEYGIGQIYNVIPTTADEAYFVMKFNAQNMDTLHSDFISFDEWREILSRNNPDEQNFLICKGAMPVAWLRISGLDNADMPWISMLAVCDKFHRQGVGTFAVSYAETYAKARGFTQIGTRITDDNLAAQGLYQRCGYSVTEHGDSTTEDGVARKNYTFEKKLR